MDDIQQLELPYQYEDEDDDVLRYLEFSDPDYTQPLLLQPPTPDDEPATDPSSTMLDSSFVLVDEGDGDLCFLDSNAAEVAASSLDCSGCHVLREVVHTNGLKSMKLSIHGGSGVFYHATFDVYYNTDGFPPAMEQSYIDLSTQDYEWVRQFLTDYGLLRVRDNYVLIQDSLSDFYDVLCTRMSFEEEAKTDTTVAEPGLCKSRHVDAGRSPQIKTGRNGIAAQRERTGKLRLSDLVGYFHLPIAVAAKELDICSTALKKICRKHGMARWPHRKIKSLDKRISSLHRELRSGIGEGAIHIQAEIERLNIKKARICAGLPP
ncbi:uncharacterized protein LOC109722850 [Ananas comosus]|uniref:Uncharacterized protein LOC109722850 n=1 Tax=Ananas comosus TaxID=4615 RepID=A0A6P5GFI3_ANACO|nr:uncharacterized protein LOC109722850 [Ananas comosus]